MSVCTSCASRQALFAPKKSRSGLGARRSGVLARAASPGYAVHGHRLQEYIIAYLQINQIHGFRDFVEGIRKLGKSIQGGLPIVGLISRLTAPEGGFDELVRQHTLMDAAQPDHGSLSDGVAVNHIILLPYIYQA